ncbi:uncharacterized protein LOC134802110 [Cydia splendana]|uniref:uncharacterized protein LOC134802110 n=1 Tax=Cydia splendana TaxID=1100963 RepID=UPI00300D93F5
MGSLQAESEEKQEMDDSGCIQDETPPSKRYPNGVQGVQLLDLSDDVLLMILRYLAPRDLRALGYTCPRLGALILDRSLWQTVDGRGQPWGRARLRWYLARALHAGTRELLVSGYAREATDRRGAARGSAVDAGPRAAPLVPSARAARRHARAAGQRLREGGERTRGRARLRWYLARALHAGTRELLVSGYAREARECLGHVNQTREEIEAAKERGDKDNGKEEDNNNQPDERRDTFAAQRVIEVPALGPNAQLYIDDQRSDSPEALAWPRPSDPIISDSTCPGPQFTLTPSTLRQLADTCPTLTSLALEYCNINCNCTSISMFPPTLKKLSLRGSKCYNLPLDRSFLFKIQDSLPDLESLDVSECEWMEPATLLPLSKLPILKHLYARDCLRLTEFVAYASLATRYGFTKLQSLDLRGSPVGDSEVSALGWLATLGRLWLSPAPPPPPPAQHAHQHRDPPPAAASLQDQWEDQEPEYFKLKEPDYDDTNTPEKCSDENNHTWQAKLNGTSSDYSSSLPTVLSSPTMIINASPLRPGSTPRSNPPRPSGSRPGTSNDSPIFNASPNEPKASSSSPTMVIHASPTRPSSSNDQRSTISCLSMSPNISITPRPNLSPPKTCCNIITPSSVLKSRSNSNPGPSKAQKRKTGSPSPGPSKRKRDDDSSSSDDDDVPLKCLIKPNVNEGASTSKESEEEKEDETEEAEENGQEDEEAQPRHHVLYVNVGQRLHAVYRLSLDNEHVVSFNRNSNLNHNTRNIFLSPPGSHLDASSLVTDSAIRRFGRADGEDINYVHIGPNGPYPGAQVPGARPDRSSLTHLSVTGFRTITDRSLDHLATSAPLLQFLDLSETNVTDAGVAAFRSLRPDCEVIYSKYEKKD